MAIKLEEITSDITLEIDEEVISIADFQKATDNFLGLVRELSKAINSEADASAWQVKVYEGSFGLGVAASPSSRLDPSHIRQVLVSGLRSLADGIRPGEFTDRAIEQAKVLASLYKKTSIEPNVRIWSYRDESVKLTRKIAETADSLLAASYEEDGSVDGILEKVDGHEKSQFVVYDIIDGRGIKCEVASDQLAQALASFKTRVEVVGRVKYRKDGMPVSIKASRIINYPSKSEIPSLSQIRRILSGGSGG